MPFCFNCNVYNENMQSICSDNVNKNTIVNFHNNKPILNNQVIILKN